MFRRRQLFLPGLFCFCGEQLYRPTPEEPYDADEVDRNVEEHLRACHGWRYALWQQLGWSWLVKGMLP